MRRRDFVAAIGGAALWPLAARAQQPAVPVIGYLHGEAQEGETFLLDAFRRGLGEQGYIERRNVEILYRWADSHYERLPTLVADLIHQNVAVIAAMASSPAALAAKAATAVTPIVFAGGTDPIQIGLVASLNRPGGNVTGTAFLGGLLIAKRLEVPHELLPAATSIAFLVNPAGPQTAVQTKDAKDAARILGLRLVILNARTPSEVEAAFSALVAQQVRALLIAADGFFGASANQQLVGLAARFQIPTMYQGRNAPEIGGLISYGPDGTDAVRIAGTYVGRILKGEKPADLPVQQSTRIEMALNLKTAKALGIEVPTATLLRATEVIE